MTGVMSSHTMAPMPPFTVHGRFRPIIGNGCHGGGSCNTPGVWLPHLHLHFISMSIIHLIYAFVELQHEYATYFNVLVL
jgi:hypothetical protein